MQSFRKVFNIYILPALLLPALMLVFALNGQAAQKKKFVVVIDAGHGGNDYGAIENGVNEKDINLAVSLKLGEIIKKKLKDTEVILTRSTDEFISLEKRADIANKARADLFISIHCNSVDKNNKNRANVIGATTFVLGQHKDADNLAVAQRENAVAELDEGDISRFIEFDPTKDENFIIYNLTQKQNFQNSSRFAQNVQKEMAEIGRYSRGVQTAGFWVLVGTYMPSALIELDFLCNPEQAKFLSSTEGQDKLAGAIFNAVKSYESYYRKTLSTSQAQTENPEAEARESEKLAEYQSEDIDRIIAAVMDEAPADEVASAATEMAELPKTRRKQKTATHNDQPKTNSSGSHRRKSGKSTSSENSAVEETIIDVAGEAANQSATVGMESSSTTGKEKESKSSTAKNAKNKDKKESNNSGQPARRDQNKKKKATKQNVNIVYRILLFTSGDELKADDPEFKGLKPVASFRENNMFKYTFGESHDKEEMENMLPQIRALFPEAYVIRIIN